MCSTYIVLYKFENSIFVKKKLYATCDKIYDTLHNVSVVVLIFSYSRAKLHKKQSLKNQFIIISHPFHAYRRFAAFILLSSRSTIFVIKIYALCLRDENLKMLSNTI